MQVPRTVPPLRPLSLRRNVAWTFVGNVVSAVCQWGVIVALAKIGTAEMVGQYALGLAVSGPILMCAAMQMRSLQATDSRGEFRFSDYLGLTLFNSFVGCLVVMQVAWWSQDSSESLLVILCVGFNKGLEFIANTFYGLFQQHERLDRITKSTVLHGVTSMTALCLGAWQTGSVFWGTVASAVAHLVALAVYDVPSAAWILTWQEPNAGSSRWWNAISAIRPQWDVGRLRRLMWLGLPLGAVGLLNSLQTNIPRYFVERHLGKSELGMFCAIAALMVAGITLMRALDQSAIPRLAKLHTAGRIREFRWLFLKLVGCYLLLGAVGVWVARWFGATVLTLLFQPEYAVHTDVLEVIMLAAVSAYLVGAISSALVATRQISTQVPLLVVTLVTSFVLCWWMVPEFGLWGGAMAMALCRLPFIAVGLIYLHRAVREQDSTAVAPAEVTTLRRAA